MTTCASSNPSAWAGCLGPGSDAASPGRLLGPWAQTVVGAGFALGVRAGTGDAPVRLSDDGRGGASAILGDDPDAGCSVTVTLRGGEPALLLRCDPFGLYGACYARAGETLWFASDPRLLGGPVDAAARHGYLCFSHVPTPETIFVGVSRLPAGGRLVVERGIERVEDGAGWREADGVGEGGEEAALRRLRDLLHGSVCRRLGEEREVGVFLSGGLDSSLIAALLARAGARVRCFTLDFGPPFDAELFCARAVADSLGLPLHIVSCRPADVRAVLDATAAALHEPFGDAVTAPLYLLGKAAARHVRVVFNGEGGDQLFGGWANKPMIAAALYGGVGEDAEAAYLATYHRFHGLTNRLYTPAARAAVGEIDAGAWVRFALGRPGSGSLLHRLRAANLRLKGAQNIAPRAVQLAEAQGLRVHAPFFDRALADWTFTLPPEWLLHGACEKYLLKRAAEEFLPPEIVWREKRGMGVPVMEWCAGGTLRRELSRRLPARRLTRDGWFDPRFVTALRRDRDVLPGEFRRRRVGEKLWCLLMLHAWIDARPRSSCGQAPPFDD